MNKIKRVNIDTITDNFALSKASFGFLLKPQGLYPVFELEPYRTTSYAIGLVLDGNKKLNINLDSYEITAPGLLMMGPELIRQWEDDANHIDIIAIFFTEDFITSGLSDIFFLKNFTYFEKTGSNYLKLDTKQFILFEKLFEQIELKHKTKDNNKIDVIRSYLHILLHEVDEVYIRYSKTKKQNFSQAENYTRKFKDLLVHDFINHREVQYYADKMFITSKHLSQILKDQTGKTASEWINEMVILEAKVLLQNKDYAIAQISNQLNFANPSFFGKFFKRNTKISPKEYRKSSDMNSKFDI